MARVEFTSGYVKVDRKLLTSSVWAGTTPDVKIVWVTLLLLMDATGEVTDSLPGIAFIAGVSPERCEEILDQFQQPDPWSRSTQYEGRRIERTERGWLVLNAPEYRGAQTPEQAKKAERMREWRAKA